MDWRKAVSRAAVWAFVMVCLNTLLLVGGFDRIREAETWSQFIIGLIFIAVSLSGSVLMGVYVEYQRAIDRRSADQQVEVRKHWPCREYVTTITDVTGACLECGAPASAHP